MLTCPNKCSSRSSVLFSLQQHTKIDMSGIQAIGKWNRLWSKSAKIRAEIHQPPLLKCSLLSLEKCKKGSAWLIGSTLAFGSRGRRFKSRWGRKNFLNFLILVTISWLLFTNEWIHDYAKWSIHKLINSVWLSKRLNNLIAGHKANWTNKT